MMLGHTYRYSVNNQSGVSLTSVVIKSRRFKFSSDGSVTWDTESTVYSQSSIASSATAWTTGTTQDNSTSKWLGAVLQVVITPSATATGPVVVQIEHSTDGGTTWPSQGNGASLGGVYFSASSAAQTKGLRVE